jgi:hypothetical protein
MKRRCIAVVALVCAHCVRWQPIALDDVRTGRLDLHTRTVRVLAPAERSDLVVHRINGTQIDAWDATHQAERRIELSRATAVQMRSIDPLGSALVVGSVYLLVFVVSWLAAAEDVF